LGLGRLLRLLSRHGHLRTSKQTRKRTQSAPNTSRRGRGLRTQINPQYGCQNCNGKKVGEHLECSPCGTVTGPHGGIALMALV
jgi:hypothetical protein